MDHKTGTRLFWSIPIAAVIGGLVLAFWPRPLEVDFVTVVRGPLVTTVSEEGKTRIRDVFVVSAPLLGRALRIEIEEGDEVIANETVVAEIQPIDPEFLDIRSEAEARADADAAQAALAFAKAELAQARAELDFATSEIARMRRLAESGTVSVRAVEDAERAYRTREAALATAEAAVEMRADQLRAAKVRLMRPTEAMDQFGECPCIPIRSPIDGRVLRVLHESEGVVAPGDPLLEVGDPADLEIVAEFLSSYAVAIQPGQRVIIDNWGGDVRLAGTVRRIEPFGLTKVSALGIEEQRVGVLIDINDPPDTWKRLGHGFEVDANVVLWESSDAAKLPLTALYRDGDEWHVFEVVNGRAVPTPVQIGNRSDTEVEVRSGVNEGSVVIRYPDDRIEAGTRVGPRS